MHEAIRRYQFNLLFYGPDGLCFLQKEKKNNKDSPTFSLLLLKDKLSLLFILFLLNFKILQIKDARYLKRIHFIYKQKEISFYL